MSSEEIPQTTVGPDAATVPHQAVEVDFEAFAAQLNQRHNRDTARGVKYGLGWVAITGVAAVGILLAKDSDEKITTELPFSPIAQSAVESVDDGLALAGMGLVVAGGLTIAGVKIGSRFKPALHSIDTASSQELTDDGKKDAGLVRRGLRNMAAGSIPAVAGVSVAVGSLMASVGTELTNGPTRPIESLFGPIPDGPDGSVSIVVQDPGANPMTESNISRELTVAIQRAAAARDVVATPVDLYLGTIYNGDQNLTSLAVGAFQTEGSPLRYDANVEGCDDVPVAIDSAANIPVGSRVNISGIDVLVVQENTDTSAINRIGVEADPSVIATCFEQNPEAPHDMVVLSADAESAQAILDEANGDLNKPAAAINEAEYIKSSKEFWKANAKPLTNVTALMAGFSSFVAMGGVMGARLMRNRREWATKLAQGVSDNQLRATELLRALKDGMVASAVGVTAATVVAPTINFLESGLRVGMDFRSAMAGSAIGIIGSLAGTATKLIRPRKVVDPAEHTRI